VPPCGRRFDYVPINIEPASENSIIIIIVRNRTIQLVYKYKYFDML